MLSQRLTQSPAVSEPVAAVYLRDPDTAACDAVNDLRSAQESVKTACDRLVRARSHEAADFEYELAVLDEASCWLAAAERRAAEVAHTRGRLGRLGVTVLEQHLAGA